MLTSYSTKQTPVQKQIYPRLQQPTRTFQDDAAMTRALPKNTVGRNRLKTRILIPIRSDGGELNDILYNYIFIVI